MKNEICKDCTQPFEITEEEIQFFTSHNLNLPKRCKLCRNRRKQEAKQQQTWPK